MLGILKNVWCKRFASIISKDGLKFMDLVTNTIEYAAEPVALKKRPHPVSDVFARLLAAGQRLIAVIYKNQGGANKDLAKFTSQINSLADKWDM